MTNELAHLVMGTIFQCPLLNGDSSVVLTELEVAYNTNVAGKFA